MPALPKAIDEDYIDVGDMSKAEAFRRLFNAARTGGRGVLHDNPLHVLSLQEAEVILLTRGDRLYFDWYQGRVMKVDLNQNPLEVRLYDRDNGKGAALRALTAPNTEGKQP